jgi:hypothetical protein
MQKVLKSIRIERVKAFDNFQNNNLYMTFSVGETGGFLWRAAPSLGAVT